MFPVAFGRYHILMAHQNQRFPVRFSLPVIKEISVYLGFLQMPVDKGKQCFQNLMKAQKQFSLIGFGH